MLLFHRPLRQEGKDPSFKVSVSRWADEASLQFIRDIVRRNCGDIAEFINCSDIEALPEFQSAMASLLAILCESERENLYNVLAAEFTDAFEQIAMRGQMQKESDGVYGQTENADSMDLQDMMYLESRIAGTELQNVVARLLEDRYDDVAVVIPAIRQEGRRAADDFYI